MIYFRADGGAGIGYGHLMRSMALAHMICTEFDVRFVSKELPDQIHQTLLSKGIQVIVIVNEDEFYSSITSNDIVVLDGYQFDLAYQRHIKDQGATLVHIDDFPEKASHADLIINHAPGLTRADFQVNDHVELAIGETYALLNSMYLAAAKKRRRPTQLECVMVCFGGADHKNLTSQVVSHLKKNKQIKQIDVVTGGGYKGDELLLPELEDERVQRYKSVSSEEMLSIMQRADCAIVSASGILYEALAAGCLVASGYYVDNQQAIYGGFKSQEAFYDLKDFSDLTPLESLQVYNFAHVKSGILDGKSDTRFKSLFKQLVK